MIKYFAQIIILIYIPYHCSGQVFHFKKNEALKLQINLNEKVHPVVYIDDLDYPNNPTININGFGNPLEVEKRLPEYLNLIGKYSGLQYDSILINKNFTVFYIWQTDGVFQIVTEKQSGKFENFLLRTKHSKQFTSYWSHSFSQSLSKNFKHHFKIKDKTGNGDDYTLHRKFITEESELINRNGNNIHIKLSSFHVQNYKFYIKISGKATEFYKITNIAYYKFFYLDELKIGLNTYLIQPNYLLTFVVYKEFPHKKYRKLSLNEEVVQNLNFELFGLHHKYQARLVNYFSTSYFKKKHGTISFKDNRFININQSSLGMFFNGQQSKTLNIIQRDTLEGLLSPVYSNSFCPIGYTFLSRERIIEPKGLLVIPNKFFISSRFKIETVNNVPWENYKNDLCK